MTAEPSAPPDLEPKPDPNEPPPPYPGTGIPVSQSQSNTLPPPYPAVGSATGQRMPEPVPVSGGQTNFVPPPYTAYPNHPAFAQPSLPGVVVQPAQGVHPVNVSQYRTNEVPPPLNSRACPMCQIGRMTGTVDITLVMCLVVMAFVLTPFTLCCIPCAFRQECTNCGYRTN